MIKRRIMCIMVLSAIFAFGTVFGCVLTNSVWISCLTHKPVKPVKVDCFCESFPSNSVNTCVCDGVSSNFCWKCFHLSCDCPKFKGGK